MSEFCCDRSPNHHSISMFGFRCIKVHRFPSSRLPFFLSSHHHLHSLTTVSPYSCSFSTTLAQLSSLSLTNLLSLSLTNLLNKLFDPFTFYKVYFSPHPPQPKCSSPCSRSQSPPWPSAATSSCLKCLSPPLARSSATSRRSLQRRSSCRARHRLSTCSMRHSWLSDRDLCR